MNLTRLTRPLKWVLIAGVLAKGGGEGASHGVSRRFLRKSSPAAEVLCALLRPPGEPMIHVSSVAELWNAVYAAFEGTAIFVAEGTCHLDGTYLRFDTPGVTLRSASGNREGVVLDGDYVTTEIAQAVGSDVTIANLTLREAYHHPIHVMSTQGGDTTCTLIHNVHIVDPRK